MASNGQGLLIRISVTARQPSAAAVTGKNSFGLAYPPTLAKCCTLRNSDPTKTHTITLKPKRMTASTFHGFADSMSQG